MVGAHLLFRDPVGEVLLGGATDMIENVPSPPDRPDSAAATRPDLLLERVADGDRDAFSQLYDVMAARVLGLIRRLLVDQAQSEEVAQEVFLEVWQTAARFDSSRGDATSWMFTLAHRRAVDRVRASQSSRDRDTRVGIRELEIEFDEVSETVEARDEHRRITAALARLTELQRQAILLAYYGGYSHREVAEKLAVPIGTVKTRLRDGMIRLRDELGVTS